MPKRKSLPNFAGYDEASDWLDAHSTADIRAKPVKVTVSPDIKIIIVDDNDNPIDNIVLKKYMSRQLRQIAKKQGISSQRLVTNWLQEKINEQKRLAK